MRTPRTSTVLVLAGLAAAPLVALATPASGATCAAPVRYAASSSRIYVAGPASVTLSDIARLCPSAPLRLVDPATRTWQLDADLVLERGAVLRLHGSESGGDVDVLRLASGSSGAVADVVTVTAQYGTLDVRDTEITSWDPVTAAPDTNPAIPAGGTRGRAFVRALSFLEGGTPRESRMDIARSDLGHLGYNGAEAYGVAYKARGCGETTPQVCDVLDVLGSQVNSRFHHNFMGTYTWGALGMRFTGNTYDANVSYGLDPHDDSDELTVTGNSFHDNGNHGFICSKRCNDLVITGNRSSRNGVTPYVGPDDVDPSDNQVHGIMLHRGVTNSVIADNEVSGHPNGAGIAIFDSVGNVVRDNRVSDNRYGLRFSVGTRGTTVTGNTVSGSSQYAVFSYRGTDVPAYTGTSGRPSDITFTGNTFAGSGSDLFKVQDSDRFTFTGGAVRGPMASGPRFERSAGHVYDVSVATPVGTTFTLRGTSQVRTTVTFRGIRPTAVKVSRDAFSTAVFTG